MAKELKKVRKTTYEQNENINKGNKGILEHTV